MSPEELEKQNRETLRRAELLELPPVSWEECKAVFGRNLIMPDYGILKFLAAYYFASKIPGKALWAFIIGPSGAGKTQLLDAMLALSDVIPVSTITPNTFLSGMPGKNDASLLPKLNGKIMLQKDWTTMLSMQKDAKSELMSQYREIWDGDYKKIFGNGAIRDWHGKISVLAASTQAVDLNQQQYTHLGERFVNYRMILPDRKTVTMRSLENNTRQDEMTIELQNAFYGFIKSVDLEKMLAGDLTIPVEYRAEIVNLANFCTMARSGVIRDFGMKKEVIFVPAAEMPTRIAGQLAKLASGLIMTNNGAPLTEEDYKIIYKVALDSIPQTNKMVIAELARADNQTTAEIAVALGYPTEPIKMYLENLALLRVCARIKDGGKADRWTMQAEFSEIIRKYEGVVQLSQADLDARKEEAKSLMTEEDLAAASADEAFDSL